MNLPSRSLFPFPLLFCASLGLVMAQVTLNPLPTRVVGQNSLTITNFNPNLVEGRELLAPQAAAVDASSGSSYLFISDTGNNRVLGFRSATGFANGQKADLVIGQPDLATTLPQGPGRTTRTTGLAQPTGLAVDGKSNLYVLDSGNNRILRFPKPFNQSGEQFPDLVIGQPGFTSNSANQGGISASTLNFTAGNALVAYLAFDPQGNLWVADAGNNRVVRFNADALGSQAGNGPAADTVLGQNDFISSGNNTPPGGNQATSLTGMTTPTGIAFDSGGRLFVSESVSGRRGRILVYTPPFASARPATRLLGVDLDNPQPPVISEFQLGQASGGLFPVGDAIGIADTGNNRLLIFKPFSQWTANQLYQPAVTVVGQPDFGSGAANQNQPEPAADKLARPAAAAFSGGELYVVDAANHRLIVLPRSGSSFGPGTRVLGQDAFNLNSPNLTEGREFNFTGNGADAGVTVDVNSNPPRLYVADTLNNRILGYADARRVKAGVKADLVIGQPDFQRTLVNYPSNNVNTPNASSLFSPTGILTDTAGNLYVADSGNGRVLRFPSPFANYSPGTPQQADLVLGQIGFTSKISDPSSRTMAAPYGLAFASDHGLLVSDVRHNRVLFFAGHPADLTSGMTASLVFGQPDFSSSGTGSDDNRMNAPHHISTDTDDRLYVADTGNGRIMIFDHAPTASPDPHAAVLLPGNRPRGVYVSPITGDIWVGDAASNQAIRYPKFNDLPANGFTSNATLAESGPLAVAQDSFGDLYVADAANRVVIHYPGLAAINSANFITRYPLAPGMIAALYSTGNLHQFGGKATSSTTLPLPAVLNGIQVSLNDLPCPIFYANPDQINIQVPMNAPQSGAADMVITEVSTGRVLGSSQVLMSPASPGLFTLTATGSGQAAALNQDGTVNGKDNPAAQNSVITLFGTGQGFIQGGPADGNISNGQLQSARKPTVIIGPLPVPDENILYAGLAPTLVGVWQLNVKIPDTTVPSSIGGPVQVIAIQNSVPSGGGGLGRAVTIYVKAKS